MVQAKAKRDNRRQLGQWMTPRPLAEQIVASLPLTVESRVLEPSFGDGAFLLPLIRRFVGMHAGTPSERLRATLARNVFGVEIDPELYASTLNDIEKEFGEVPPEHNLVRADFFRVEHMSASFDVVVGNPPFGGTFDPEIEDSLDKLYGRWDGHKLKKETYSFFIARSLEWLAPGGLLAFIASDTFLTIKTMGGLRRKLLDLCDVRIENLPSFSEQTTQPTLVLRAKKSGRSEQLTVDDKSVPRTLIEKTGNFSWRISDEWAHYFDGPMLGEFIIATSGMTIGNNELFVRRIDRGTIEEPFEFEFFEDPITYEREVERARLNRLSPRIAQRVKEQELAGETRRNVRVTERSGGPVTIALPHPDYRPYNKAQGKIVYAPPTDVIFWRDEGDAVLTFKKNGNWYLGGVGGQKFFGREGLTWQLVAPKLNMRYLPAGQILDSGAPAAFLRPGVPDDELWFVLGWSLTEAATTILKTVINHTRNVQSKDVERLPYPHWMDEATKADVVALVKQMVSEATEGRTFDRTAAEIAKLDSLFVHPAK